MYGNGPGYGITKDSTIAGKNTIQAAAAPRHWATHGGEDVPVFATGPLANLFSGTIDQTYIPHAISYIACLGSFRDRCGCLYFSCETEILNTTCSDGECETNDIGNAIMISDQLIAAQMQLISGTTVDCNYNTFKCLIIAVFLLIFNK